MADPYWKYTSVDRDAETSFPGYIPPQPSAVTCQPMWNSGILGPSSELLQHSIRSGGYSLDELAAIRNYAIPGNGLATRSSVTAHAAIEDSAIVQRAAATSIGPGVVDLARSDPLRNSVGLPAEGSNVLYVDGLPTDCTRREVSHLFRPFIGFKDIKVVHKEARGSGDKARVLCFVEFDDAKCALVALQALEGYKFDIRKPDAPALRIQFAQFPFHPPPLANHT